MPTPGPVAFALALLCHASCWADDFVLQRVLVEGARTSMLGVADSANAGSVTQKQLEMRTAYRPGELLEAVPGLVVSQNGGAGKANQFYLRGFNLDHGTDLRTTLDEMPVNQRSHAHGQGWTDLNFLIPELAARLDYKKGPYSAREGDFASAGSAAITYANRLAQGSASASVGQHGFARTLVAASPDLGQGSLLYAIELLHNDGPFTRPDDYRKTNAVLRYSEGYANNGFSVSAMAYRGRWNASDQIPQRALDAGLLGRFDSVDASGGASAQRYSLSALWRRSDNEAASKVSAYLIGNRLDLYSNFTYFLDDPVNGDQFNQPDRRVTSGIGASHTWHTHAGARNSDLTLGAHLQNDNIFNGLYPTRARSRLAVTREDHVQESSLGVFVEHHARWSDTFRTLAGMRADAYRFAVRSDRPENSGTTHAHLLSPSLNLVFGPWKLTEFYLNAGHGFHSNDARGTLTTLDPKSGGAADPVPGLVRSHAIEAGVRSQPVAALQTSLSLYRLDFDSELTFVGDAGSTEAGHPSRRCGFEFSAYFRALTWLSVDLDLAFARARSRGVARNASFIPGAVEGVGQLALSVLRAGPWSGALRLRYVGPRPLAEDDSVRAQHSLTLNARLAYRAGAGVRIELEGFNLTDRRAAASEYFYASRLQGESAARQDRHVHPLEPRSLRLALVKNF